MIFNTLKEMLVILEDFAFTERKNLPQRGCTQPSP